MPSRKKPGSTAADFRRLALSFDGAEESSHMGNPDFRVGGHIFATLAHQSEGLGNLALNPEDQAAFCEEAPDVFRPIPGGWGRMGMTHIVLANAGEAVLGGALEAAWQLRAGKNLQTRAEKKAKTKRRLT